MSDSMFLIKDKNSKSIKQDASGMLCLFTSKGKAEKYLKSIYAPDREESELLEITCKIKAVN